MKEDSLFCGELEEFEELLLFTPVEQRWTSIMSWEGVLCFEKSIKNVGGRKRLESIS